MNPTIRNIIIGAGLYFGYIMMANKNDNKGAGALRMELKDIDVDFHRVRFIINIANPTSGNLVIHSIVGDLFFNGTKVANIKSFAYAVIKANSQYNLPVEGELLLANAAAVITAAFASKQPTKINFIGSINLNGSLVPLTLNFIYPTHG